MGARRRSRSATAYCSGLAEILSRACSTLPRNLSPRPSSRWSNQSRACWRSSAASRDMRTGRFNGAPVSAADGGPSSRPGPPSRAARSLRLRRTSQGAGAVPPRPPGSPGCSPHLDWLGRGRGGSRNQVTPLAQGRQGMVLRLRAATLPRAGGTRIKMNTPGPDDQYERPG